MGEREGRPYGEAGTGGVEPRPYGGVTRSAVNGPSGTPAPTEGYKGRGRTGGVEPRPYGWVASSAAEWATARVAPTGCNMGCGGAAG